MMNSKIYLPIRQFVTRAANEVKEKAIPGPKYYPFLGPINDILTMGKAEKLHLTIDEYHRKYGPVFKTKLGSTDAVFISSPTFIRSIFNHEGKFPKHSMPPSWLYFNKKHSINRGLLFMDGEEWYEHRKIMNSILMKDSQWTETIIRVTCDNFIKKIKRSFNTESDEVIDNLEDELYLWSTYSILNLMLGSSTHEQSDREFDENVWKFVTSAKQIWTTSAKLLTIPPAIADKLHLKVWKDFEKTVHESISLSRKMISAFNDKNVFNCSKDGLFMKLKSHNLSDEMMTQILSDLIFAAGDTTVSTMSWCLHKIAKHNEIQSMMRKSIYESDFDYETPLVRAFLKEVLRLYPVAPFIGRILDTEATLGAYKIPKGWFALTSQYSAGHDPQNFVNPEKFSPKRWLRDEKTEKLHDFNASLPFAMGVRSCVGKKIATYQIHTLITKILQEFNLTSFNKDEVEYTLKLIGLPNKKILIGFKARQ
ncbi:CLUMA_CG013624, isoform A [Clunio marinus]|uniref:CLUMA_CG013624, isoform A n=1 Tax=Clunio marinus TaxID=568069 RepID=A0A1J1IJC8_9DIPT|nr:CLUMA_CG013624, isoform A [Clunio marinus]